MLHFITGGKILKGDENGREGGVEGAGGESVGEEGGAVDLPGGVGMALPRKGFLMSAIPVCAVWFTYLRVVVRE